MSKRNRKIFATLTDTEYLYLLDFLEKRNQPMTEYVLMALATFMEDPNSVVEKRKRQKGAKQVISVRCSDYVASSIANYACTHCRNKNDVVICAIKEAIQG